MALARALAPEPSVLLLDEPFAAIDTKIRRELRKWVRKIHDEIGITSIFVTHDQEEALEIADRVLVMNQGRLEQLGTPEEVYHQPKSLFVANFVGEANHGQGTVERGKLVVGPLMFSVDQADGAKLSVVFRPSDVQLSPVGGERGNSVNAEGEIIHLTYKGTYYTADVRLQGGMQIQASLSPDQTAALGVGSRVGIHVKRVLMFDSEGRALPTENAVAVGAV
ncbi:hypothetical protein GCM10025857_12140 [Alicyclobacillus contaminans]|nr:hypothetical protein GCM10025857_12140 [Alicyclobacillus contaminans]